MLLTNKPMYVYFVSSTPVTQRAHHLFGLGQLQQGGGLSGGGAGWLAVLPNPRKPY